MDQIVSNPPIFEFYMRRAIELAREAAALGEVPVGAVLVEDLQVGASGRLESKLGTGTGFEQMTRTAAEPTSEALLSLIRGEGYNRREIDRDPLAHAETLAIAQASKNLDRWRLSGCTLYVTLEPCLMCAGSIINSRVDRVVFGALDSKAGAVKSLYQTLEDGRFNHRPQVIGGILADECSSLLKEFFKKLR